MAITTGKNITYADLKTNLSSALQTACCNVGIVIVPDGLTSATLATWKTGSKQTVAETRNPPVVTNFLTGTISRVGINPTLISFEDFDTCINTLFTDNSIDISSKVVEAGDIYYFIKVVARFISENITTYVGLSTSQAYVTATFDAKTTMHFRYGMSREVKPEYTTDQLLTFFAVLPTYIAARSKKAGLTYTTTLM